jgi:hypothetical protein
MRDASLSLDERAQPRQVLGRRRADERLRRRELHLRLEPLDLGQRLAMQLVDCRQELGVPRGLRDLSGADPHE